MKVAFNGISEERERIECLPRRVRRAFRVRPPDREREIRTTRNPKQAPTSLSLSLSASATRESKMGRRIEINAPMSKSALARLFSSPDNGVDTHVPNYTLEGRPRLSLSNSSVIRWPP